MHVLYTSAALRRVLQELCGPTVRLQVASPAIDKSLGDETGNAVCHLHQSLSWIKAKFPS